MKNVRLYKVKDGGLFKRVNRARGVWFKKIKEDKYRYFICTSTNSEKSFSFFAGKIVYVKA